MLKNQIEQDLKTALLSGEKEKATVLRGLKSAILYAEVAQEKRANGLTDEEIVAVLTKEAKKRQESADLYVKGGNQDRATLELQEKTIIEKYLPQQLTDDEISKVIDSVISETGSASMQDMGRVIGGVKSKVGATADGAIIARLVKARLSQ